jgi:putative polymerase
VLFFLAALCVVLADSRFAAGCCILMLLLRLTPLYRSAFVVFIIPICVMMLLTMAGSLHELPGVLPSILSDDLSGRLLFSGRLLDYWNLPQWFALAASQVYTADTGYAYTINTLGLPLTLLYLGLFAFHRTATREATIMKACLSIYFATSLCVGASVFTIKTAALLWLLYGALNAPGRVPARRPSRSGAADNDLMLHSAV